MKKQTKLFTIFMALLLCISASLFAQEAENDLDLFIDDTPEQINPTNPNGMFFDIDLGVSGFGRVLLSEEVLYKYTFNNGIALDAGIRVCENFINKASAEPYFYFAPIIDFNYKGFFIGGGPLLTFEDTVTCTFLARTGGNFGHFNWGKATGHVRASFEISAMYGGIDPKEGGSATGAVFASLFTTVLNFPKIQVGCTCDLPF